MSWTLAWSPPAQKDMRRLDQQSARRVRRAIVRLAETGEGDVDRLRDITPPEWRLRVGDWRVRFRFRPEEKILQILRVLPRGEAYRAGG